MNQKIFRAPIELKADGEEGEFIAVFSTLNVIDHHIDVTLPGHLMSSRWWWNRGIMVGRCRPVRA
jgi:hypothetical protein